MKTVFNKFVNFFKPKKRVSTKQDRVIARASAALAVVLLMAPILFSNIEAKGEKNTGDDPDNYDHSTLFKWCQAIAEGTGKDFCDIFSAGQMGGGKTDYQTAAYAYVFQYCTGITGNVFNPATNEVQLGMYTYDVLRDNWRENFYEYAKYGDLIVYYPDTVMNKDYTGQITWLPQDNWEICNIRTDFQDVKDICNGNRSYGYDIYTLNDHIEILKKTGQEKIANQIIKDQYVSELEISTTSEKDLYSGGNITEAYGFFISALETVGAIFFLIRLLGGIWQRISDGHDPVEQWLVALVKMGLGLAIIFNADKIVSAVCYIGFYLGSQVTSNYESETYSAEILYKELNVKKGFTGLIEGTITLMIPYAISYIINIAAQFMIISTMLEIGIRRVFVPIPICDVYSEGLRSPGIRYLKKLLAAILKLVLAYFILQLGNHLLVVLARGKDTTIIGVVVAKVSTIGLMFKTGEYANDILSI